MGLQGVKADMGAILLPPLRQLVMQEVLLFSDPFARDHGNQSCTLPGDDLPIRPPLASAVSRVVV